MLSYLHKAEFWEFSKLSLNISCTDFQEEHISLNLAVLKHKQSLDMGAVWRPVPKALRLTLSGP